MEPDFDWAPVKLFGTLLGVPAILVAAFFFVRRAMVRRQMVQAQRARAADERVREADEQRLAGLAAQQKEQDERAREAEQQRLAEYVQRFGQDIAERVMRREVWQGMTAEMLVASLGSPADVDETVLKTKRKHVYKYNPQGANRFGHRIFLENDTVVGWEDKR
ncbi:MAG: hypothetical protein U0359_01105 [Byssovorax sp.]